MIIDAINYAEGEADMVIADGATTSGTVRCHTFVPVAVGTDADFDGAALSLEHSFDGTTGWQDVRASDGTIYSVTVSASQFAVLDLPKVFGAFRYVRLKSDVAQSGSASTVKVLFSK